MFRLAVAALLVGAGALWGGTAQAQGVVKIGVMSDMTGSSADAGGPGSVTAVELAVEEFGGTVAGRKIEIVSADHQWKPDIGRAIAGRWYDVEGVDVIVDLPISSVALAVQHVATERKKIVLISGAATSDITGKGCSAYTIHWATDTNALAEGTARAVVQAGGKSWFFLTNDFVFARTLEEAASGVIKADGGSVRGSTRVPLGTTDYSSFLLQAQASKSEIVGLTQVSADLINVVKQSSEFGIVARGQKLVGFLVFITDIHSLGLNAAKGLRITSSFYWDQNEKTRAFAERFKKRRNAMPTDEHAEIYASVVHYLNAVKGSASTESDKTMAWMKANPADYFGQKVRIREDGRALFDLGLYEVKASGESKQEWDYYKKIGELSPDKAFRPIDRESCSFLRQ